MKALKVLVLVAPLLLPAAAFADTETTRCYASHLVRGVSGDELLFTVIYFNNGDLEHPAVIERLTIRDDEGGVIHDSGPKTPTPHPLATGVVPPQDITTVPPGGVFPFSTTDIWGLNSIPLYQGRGNRSLSVTVEVSKAGNPKLFMVHTRAIARQRFFLPTPPFGLGAERAISDTACFSVRNQRD